MATHFKFKQFTIGQDRCAMKVGTDGVLLGAWVPLHFQPQRILDVGSGTGLLALMLAQRSNAATIDAVEVDNAAFEQCVENFEASPWSDRLFCYHASFQEFYIEIEERYDLIISNPPFYVEDFSSGQLSRDTARQNQWLPFATIFEGADKLLSEDGNLAMIIPYASETSILNLANTCGFYPVNLTHVRGNPNTLIKRSLLQFSRTKGNPNIQELAIELERDVYTQEYRKLTRDFYLKM